LTDNYVQIPPNSSGLKIDTSELTVNSQTVERQRIVLADPITSGSLASVSFDGLLAVSDAGQEAVLDNILLQLKRIALLLEIHTGREVSLADIS